MFSLLFSGGAVRVVRVSNPHAAKRRGTAGCCAVEIRRGSANATRRPHRGPHVRARARVSCLTLPACLFHSTPLACKIPTPAQNGKPDDPKISETTLLLGGGDGAAAGLGELVGLMPDFRVNFAHGAARPPRHRHLDEQHAALDDGLRRHVLRPLVPTLQVSGHGGILTSFVFECCSSLQNCFIIRATYMCA